jgi:hypothetical protein
MSEMPEGELIEAESIEGLSETAEKVMLYALQEAEQMLEDNASCPPFTIIVKGEDLEIENHPGETITECLASARVAVFEAKEELDYYAFCYDGYLETDRGHRDAIICECAEKLAENCHAIAALYDVQDAEEGEMPEFYFEDEIIYLGESPSFFSKDYDFSGSTSLDEEIEVTDN